MSGAIQRYCEASAANDIDRLLETVTTDAELVSPLSARMVFRGKDDLRVLLGAVYGDIAGLRWREPIGVGDTRVALAQGRIGPFQLGDAMVFELAADGSIRRIRPHLRPWLGATFLGVRLALALSRQPAVLLRALRRG